MRMVLLISIVLAFLPCFAWAQEPENKETLQYDLTTAPQALYDDLVNKPQALQEVIGRESFTLLTALRYGLQHNTDILQSRLGLEITESGEQSAEGEFNPTISASVDTSRNRSPFQTTAAELTGRDSTDSISDSATLSLSKKFSPGTTLSANASVSRYSDLQTDDPDSNTSTLTLSLTQPLLRGYGMDINDAGQKIAALSSQAERARLSQNIAYTANSIVQNFWYYADAAESLAIVQTSMARLNGLMQEFDTLTARGLYDAGDRGVIEARLAERQSTLLASEDLLRSYRNSLGLSMGVGDAERDQIPLPEYTLYRAQEIGKQTYERYLAHAKETRGDLIGERLSSDQQEIRLQLSENNLLPDLSVVGSVGKERVNTGTGISDTIRTIHDGNSADSWSMGMSLSYPIGNDSAQADLRAQRATQLSQKLRVRDLERSITFSIAEAYESLESTRAQMTQSETTFNNFLQVYKKQLADFRLGKASLFDLLQTEDALTNAESSLASMMVSYYRQLANFRYETDTLLSTKQQDALVFEEKRFLSAAFLE
ncbi:MAG: TolC family protein [Alphaproteobacteria bacterium]|nr:TolC family protein [Alphaproteobacteria bacterium]